MKQKVLVTFLSVAFVALVMFSCKKKIEATIPPANSEFAFQDNSAKGFYVLSTSPGDTYKIPIGITTPLDHPVTINFTYTSATAVAGTQYTAPASITIPAGKVLDSISMKGIFANIPAGVSHTVVAKISGGDLPAVVGRDSIVIVLRRYCNVNVAALAGNYTTVENSIYTGVSAPYTSSVSNVVQTGPTTATAVMNNIWGFNITANIIFDWTDPANFKVFLNPTTQTTYYLYGGTAATFITQASGTSNSFSSCANTITMNFRFYTGAGTFDQWRADMVHQ
jgi:hypothetical protein